MFRTFIQTTSLILTFLASVFWIQGSVALSVRDMAALAGTHWGHNSATLQSLAQQKSDSLVAVVLLLLSFSLQLVNVLLPMRIKDFGVSKQGTVVSVLFCLLLSAVCWKMDVLLAKHWYAKASVLLEGK